MANKESLEHFLGRCDSILAKYWGQYDSSNCPITADLKVLDDCYVLATRGEHWLLQLGADDDNPGVVLLVPAADMALEGNGILREVISFQESVAKRVPCQRCQYRQQLALCSDRQWENTCPTEVRA